MLAPATVPATAPSAAVSAPTKAAPQLPSAVSPPAVTTRSAAALQPLKPKDFSAALNGTARFVENKGQWDERVRFQVRVGPKTMWLTDTGIVFDSFRALPKPESTSDKAPSLGNKQIDEPQFERLVFNEDLLNGSTKPAIEPIDPQPGVYNYLQDSDPSKWHTGVKGYGGVIYHDVWAGIDLRLLRKGKDIEQEFLLHPGADVSLIRVEYRGIEGLKLADDGSLAISTRFGELRESRPAFYRQSGGNSELVEGRFKLTSEHSYTFEVDAQPSEYALLIDPTLLYSSFLGGNKSNTIFGVAVDSTGAAFLVGQTTSADFPVTPGAFTGPAAFPQWTVFLSKVSPLGDKLLFSTLLGPGYGHGVAVDAHGIPYIAGVTSPYGGAYFPNTPNAFSGCGNGAFLAKLSPSGDSLLYSTCFGNGSMSNDTGANSVAVDSQGSGKVEAPTIATSR